MLKAMAKSPDDRYPTAAALQSALLSVDLRTDDAVPMIVRDDTAAPRRPPDVRPERAVVAGAHRPHRGGGRHPRHRGCDLRPVRHRAAAAGRAARASRGRGRRREAVAVADRLGDLVRPRRRRRGARGRGRRTWSTATRPPRGGRRRTGARTSPGSSRGWGSCWCSTAPTALAELELVGTSRRLRRRGGAWPTAPRATRAAWGEAVASQEGRGRRRHLRPRREDGVGRPGVDHQPDRHVARHRRRAGDRGLSPGRSGLSRPGSVRSRAIGDDRSDAALVAAAQAGDRGALDTLLRRHHDRLYALCRRVTGNDADGADACQEALIAIVRGLDRFDGRSAFSTWAYRVATNACLDELRRRRRRPEPGLPDGRDRRRAGRRRRAATRSPTPTPGSRSTPPSAGCRPSTGWQSCSATCAGWPTTRSPRCSTSRSAPSGRASPGAGPPSCPCLDAGSGTRPPAGERPAGRPGNVRRTPCAPRPPRLRGPERPRRR